jgi:hypothetical protein
MGMRETYMENIQAQMKEWDIKMKELKIEAENSYLQQVGYLEEKYKMINQKVEEIKSADNETWEKLAGDLQVMMIEFKNILSNIRTKVQ